MSVIKQKRIRGRLHVWFSTVPEEAFIVHRVAGRYKTECAGWKVTHRATSFGAGKPLPIQADAIAEADRVMGVIGAEKVRASIRKAERQKTRTAKDRKACWQSFRAVAGNLRQYHPRKRRHARVAA